MAKEEKEKEKEEMKDLDPKKNPKGGKLGTSKIKKCGSQTRLNYQC